MWAWFSHGAGRAAQDSSSHPLRFSYTTARMTATHRIPFGEVPQDVLHACGARDCVGCGMEQVTDQRLICAGGHALCYSCRRVALFMQSTLCVELRGAVSEWPCCAISTADADPCMQRLPAGCIDLLLEEARAPCPPAERPSAELLLSLNYVYFDGCLLTWQTEQPVVPVEDSRELKAFAAVVECRMRLEQMVADAVRRVAQPRDDVESQPEVGSQSEVGGQSATPSDTPLEPLLEHLLNTAASVTQVICTERPTTQAERLTLDGTALTIGCGAAISNVSGCLSAKCRGRRCQAYVCALCGHVNVTNTQSHTHVKLCDWNPNNFVGDKHHQLESLGAHMDDEFYVFSQPFRAEAADRTTMGRRTQLLTPSEEVLPSEVANAYMANAVAAWRLAHFLNIAHSPPSLWSKMRGSPPFLLALGRYGVTLSPLPAAKSSPSMPGRFLAMPPTAYVYPPHPAAPQSASVPDDGEEQEMHVAAVPVDEEKAMRMAAAARPFAPQPFFFQGVLDIAKKSGLYHAYEHRPLSPMASRVRSLLTPKPGEHAGLLWQNTRGLVRAFHGFIQLYLREWYLVALCQAFELLKGLEMSPRAKLLELGLTPCAFAAHVLQWLLLMPVLEFGKYRNQEAPSPALHDYVINLDGREMELTLWDEDTGSAPLLQILKLCKLDFDLYPLGPVGHVRFDQASLRPLMVYIAELSCDAQKTHFLQTAPQRMAALLSEGAASDWVQTFQIAQEHDVLGRAGFILRQTALVEDLPDMDGEVQISNPRLLFDWDLPAAWLGPDGGA